MFVVDGLYIFSYVYDDIAVGYFFYNLLSLVLECQTIGLQMNYINYSLHYLNLLKLINGFKLGNWFISINSSSLCGQAYV